MIKKFATRLKKTFVLGICAVMLISVNIYAEQDYDYDDEAASYDGLPLESEFSIVICAITSHVLYGRGIHDRAYPASMTKVMTTLMLLESGLAMDELIIHTPRSISTVVPWHSHVYYLVDYVTVEQALYTMMLWSANDVSNAVAEHLGGTLENFAEMMTARARELGAINTNFANAHGLWEQDHYTTPYDMALIMREAISHPRFVEIIATQRFMMESQDDPEEFHMRDNTNSMIHPASQHFNPDIVGGKTGFTNMSRQTLVSYGQRRDMRLITVIMRADQRDIRYSDTRMLMDYGFEQFQQHNLFAARDFTQSVDLVQRSDDGVLVIGEMPVVAAGDLTLPLPIGFDTSSITIRTELPDRIAIPVDAGDFAGRVVAEIGGAVIGYVVLHTAEAGLEISPDELAALFPEGQEHAAAGEYADEESNFSVLGLLGNIVLIILSSFVVLVILIRFLRFQSYKRRRAKYRRSHAYNSAIGGQLGRVNSRYRYK